MRFTPFDYALLWVFTFGVWPLADPGHHADSLLSMADIVLHLAALITFCVRWKMVRR